MRLTALLLFAMLLVAALADETVNLRERNKRGWWKKGKKGKKTHIPQKTSKIIPKKPHKPLLERVNNYISKAEGIASSIAATQQIIDGVNSLANALGLTKITQAIPETVPEGTPEDTPEE